MIIFDSVSMEKDKKLIKSDLNLHSVVINYFY